MVTGCMRMVMPRSRSRSMESRSWFWKSRWLMALVLRRNWSASVLLPWSMWAMIEKLRIRRVSVLMRWIRSLLDTSTGRAAQASGAHRPTRRVYRDGRKKNTGAAYQPRLWGRGVRAFWQDFAISMNENAEQCPLLTVEERARGLDRQS